MLPKIKRLPFMNSTLKSRVFFSMILFAVIPFVIVVVITSVFMTGNAMSQYKEDIAKSLAVSVENINEKINRYIMKSSYLCANQYIIKNIKQEFDNLDQMITFSNMLGHIIGEPYDIGQKRPYTIFSGNKTIYDSKFIEYIGAAPDNPWLSEAAGAPTTEIVWVPTLTEKSERSYLTFYRSIVEFRSFLGVLEVNIPFETLLPDIKNIHLPESAKIFLVDSEKEIFYSVQDLQINDAAAFSRQGDCFFIESAYIKNGYKILVAVPNRELSKIGFSSNIIIVGFGILYLFLMYVASRASARRITIRLEEFIAGLKDINVILHTEKIIVSGNDEISFIQQKFKTLIEQINKMYHRIIDIKLKNSILEIELLQAQFNPHLLYNSLSVIKWNALRSKDDKTVSLIDSMTKYYRMALSSDGNIIKLSSELVMIREYVKIMEHSDARSYGLTIDIDEPILSCFTLKHILQPIVENAIMHGLRGTETNARIDIKGSLCGDTITITVSDNGRGLSSERAREVLELEAKPAQGSYGLRNLTKRIMACYGDDYRLFIQSKEGAGTVVTVKIAALSEKELLETIRTNLTEDLNTAGEI